MCLLGGGVARRETKMEYINKWRTTLTGLQDFDDNALIVQSVDSFVHFRVLASTDLLDDLIVVLGPAQQQSKLNNEARNQKTD